MNQVVIVNLTPEENTSSSGLPNGLRHGIAMPSVHNSFRPQHVTFAEVLPKSNPKARATVKQFPLAPPAGLVLGAVYAVIHPFRGQIVGGGFVAVQSRRRHSGATVARSRV